MKQAGMRRAEANLNPMLALWVALCNQTWKTSWQEIEARIIREKYPVQTSQKTSQHKQVVRQLLRGKLSTPDGIS